MTIEAVDGYPLSAQQLRMLRRPDVSNLDAAVTFAVGDLDQRRLDEGLRRLVERHEALRTRLVPTGGYGAHLQVVDPSAGRLRAEVTGPPGARRVTLRIAAEAVDAASLIVLADELHALCTGADLPDPVQYAQFDAWQQAVSAEAGMPEGPPAHLPLANAELLTAGLTTGEAGAVTAWRDLAVPAPERLTRRAREFDATVADLLLAAWGTTVARRAGRDAAGIGVVFHARSFAELDSTVGPLARTLPLRLPASDDLPASELIRQVARDRRALEEWQEAVAWPAYDRIEPMPVQFQHVGAATTGFPVVDLTHPGDPAQMRLLAVEHADGLRVRLLFDPERVTAFRAESYAEAYTAVLSTVVDGDVRLGDLDAVAGAERDLVLGDWAHGGGAVDDRTIPEAFRAQVDRTPDAVALVDGTVTLRYAELDAAASVLAHRLRGQGVATGDRVGFWGDRSADAIVCMLAILAAGAVAVPVDVDTPAPLVAELLADADVRHFLGCHGTVPAGVVRVDAGWAGEPAVPRATAGVAGQAPAYVIFTSGSTGRPKGVCVAHRSLTSYVAHMGAALGLRPGWRSATVATTAVDLGFTALFGALLTGGSFEVLPKETLLDPAAMAGVMPRVDCLKTTPSHLRTLLAASDGDMVLPRALLVLGGEELDRALLSEVVRRRPAGMEIVNHYGPTEACVGVLAHRVTDDDVAGDGAVPLGRPVGAVSAYVLDPQGSPVPIGSPGELCLSGAAVAIGYLGRLEATAERFGPNPYAPGERLYRTGDAVAWNPDGTLRFLGRIDAQTKIRGHRVEPDALRTVLLGHPDVAGAVVAVRPLAGDEPGLVAYVVADPGLSVDEAGDADGQVSTWRTLFDSVYGDALDEPDDGAALDLTGWTSSYTGEPMSQDEITESVAGITDRVTALPHDRVLEIGFGTGLLIREIAPRVSHYHATDISAEAVRLVRRTLTGPEYAGLRLEVRAATDLSGIDPGSVDVVVLNSVIQYFPSLDYLTAVLRAAATVVRPGGHIFVGDVRDLRLAPVFHSSVEAARAADGTPLVRMRERAAAALAAEAELMVDPAFFTGVRDLVPGVSTVRLQLKYGRHDNELTKFRYDVVLGVGEVAPVAPAVPELAWPIASRSVDEIVAAGPCRVRGVVDARTSRDVGVHAAFAVARDGDLYEPGTGHEPAGAHPQEWWDAGRRHGVAVAVAPPASGAPGEYDVLVGETTVPHQPLVRPVDAYANDPFFGRRARALVARLQRHLAERVPAALVPAHIMVLPELPMTASGKVDLTRLPQPQAVGGAPEHVAPRTPVEELVAQVWAEILRVPRLSVFDDFFELGGHSLLAVQAIFRIREATGVNVSLRDFFAGPTVSAFSVCLTEAMLDEEALPA